MPFTLAHPAAVLPLRGWKCLRTAPLIIGAVIPDLPYYLPGGLHRRLPETHSFTGSFTTDLLLGYMTLVALFLLRQPLTALLPARTRWLCLNAFATFRRGRLREWACAPLAILVGVWTHLLWDSFTHYPGWMVQRMVLLRMPVTIGPYTTQVYHLLQYLSSAFGLLVMAVWYWRLRAPPARAAEAGPARSPAGPVLVLAAVAAILIGGVQALVYFNHWHGIYGTLDVLLTHSLAWFGALYLLAGTIVTLERAH